MSEEELVKSIEEKAKRIYKERFGKRDPRTVDSKDMEKVNHDAGIEEQRERSGKRERIWLNSNKS